MNKYALLVASGTGTRMNQTTPKQFLNIGEKPILLHTLERFYQADHSIHIILVIAKEYIEPWKKIVKDYDITIPHEITQGGENRYQSVANGLADISKKDENEKSLIAIHDGVRPFVTKDIINKSYELAEIHGTAIPCVMPKDTVKQLVEKKVKTLDRSSIRLAQTPQTFQASIIQQTYRQTKNSPAFTDDASMAEAAGFPIFLFEGSYDNIKITTPEDLYIAEKLLTYQLK